MTDAEVLDAFATLARTEGIIPALEPAHALAWVIRERAVDWQGQTVLVNLSGRGDKDVAQVMELTQTDGDETATPPVAALRTRGRLESSPARRSGRGPQAARAVRHRRARRGWTDVVRALADAGADAIEIGIPFSDPVMDGPTIQEASERALANGATPASILTPLRGVDVGVPLVAMTYYNLVFRAGNERFAANLADSGVSGIILPDVPMEEQGPWRPAADAARHRDRAAGRADHPRRPAGRGLPAEQGLRLRRNAHGGHRRADDARRGRGRAGQAAEGGHRPSRHHGLRHLDDRSRPSRWPSTPTAWSSASAIMRRLLEGASVEDVHRFVAGMRAALDRG